MPGGPTRRQFLTVSAAMPLAPVVPALPEPPMLDSVAADLRQYIQFGHKQSGGPGDEACGHWLDTELIKAGYVTERLYFSVPWFEEARSEIVIGDTRTPVWPQPIVRTTDEAGLSAPIIRVDGAGRSDRPLSGAIALIDLPFGRWSSMFWPQVKTPVDAAFAAGAAACVIVTNGPSGQVIALNTDGRKPLYSGPVALLAPHDAGPVFAAALAGGKATLRMTGRGGRRPAFNLIGRIDRGHDQWVVVSTPRSGWFVCAGERGGGIAAWLHLARWASVSLPGYNLAAVCNSGHEYQYLGAKELLHKASPAPEKTAFWLHLGANLAARDWHEAVGQLQPLPGTDSQRYLVVNRELLAVARSEFAGLAGLEAPYGADQLSAGELRNIIDAGYRRVAGVFGVHRFHHVADDDGACVSVDAVALTTRGFRRFLEGALI